MSRNSSKLSSVNSNSSSNKENFGHREAVGRLVEIKSKFEAEFRRFSIPRTGAVPLKFEDFSKLVQHYHQLFDIPFALFYTDPVHGDLLPINNDDNFAKAISSATPVLRLHVQKKGDGYNLPRYDSKKKPHFLNTLVGLNNLLDPAGKQLRPSISMPEDFRMVSAIIDVDIVPDSCRRVRLVKHGSDKPLGFYIRDGTSVRMTPHGLEKVPGIFISRLVPGGLAESTGLLAVNDEVLEVNGIEVLGKTLDQVTDMMVANSSNLIITIRPANQRGFRMSGRSSAFGGSAFSPNHEIVQRSSVCRTSQASSSGRHCDSVQTDEEEEEEEEDEEDEVRDHIGSSSGSAHSYSGGGCGGGGVGQGVKFGGPGPKLITTSVTVNSCPTDHDSDDNPDDVVTL